MSVVRTRLFKVDPLDPDPAIMAECAALLRAGGTVSFPTETVYGLGACALSADAVSKIFRAKGRPADNPLIVHVHDAQAAWDLAQSVPVAAKKLASAFWPGPLTLVLHKSHRLPEETTAGLPTFGVRVPDHSVALRLLEEAGIAIAAPSANVSGRPSPTTAEHVLADLDGHIDAVVDGGPTQVGLESTVVDVTVDPPVILRHGGITREQLEAVIGWVIEGESGRKDMSGDHDSRNGRLGARDTPRSPGVKYRHYAPRAKVRLLEGSPERIAAIVMKETAEPAARRSSGYVLSSETASLLEKKAVGSGLNQTLNDDRNIVVLGKRSHPEEAAKGFYAALRLLDEKGVEEIVIEQFDAIGIGRALVDRIQRAAGRTD